VNADIARFLSGGNLIADFEWLNSLEEQMLGFLDFDLYVSVLDFNRISSKVNTKVKENKEAQTAQFQK
jgi:hypothetical protein